MVRDRAAAKRVNESNVALKVVPGTEAGRPFLKWAGGKRQLLPSLLRLAPRNARTYFEPFVGGGALFFALRPKRAVLADVNQRLIRAFRGVKSDVEEVTRQLKGFKYNPEFFYRFREVNIDGGTDADVAAWFIYLNRTGFNGLYRVNRDNRFNVPFGRYVNPTICDEDTLRACSAALANADLVVDDFATIVKNAGRDDFVYFDPPYVPLSATSSFTSYTSQGFDHNEQTRLRDTARKLKKRGVRVLLSNSSAPSVRALYAEAFDITEVSATRLVNSKASARGAIVELLIR